MFWIFDITLPIENFNRLKGVLMGNIIAYKLLRIIFQWMKNKNSYKKEIKQFIPKLLQIPMKTEDNYHPTIHPTLAFYSADKTPRKRRKPNFSTIFTWLTAKLKCGLIDTPSRITSIPMHFPALWLAEKTLRIFILLIGNRQFVLD